jgi:hypothetical protein
MQVTCADKNGNAAEPLVGGSIQPVLAHFVQLFTVLLN